MTNLLKFDATTLLKIVGIVGPLLARALNLHAYVYGIKPTKPNQTEFSQPSLKNQNLQVKAVNTWVRSAFDNV